MLCKNEAGGLALLRTAWTKSFLPAGNDATLPVPADVLFVISGAPLAVLIISAAPAAVTLPISGAPLAVLMISAAPAAVMLPISGAPDAVFIISASPADVTGSLPEAVARQP